MGSIVVTIGVLELGQLAGAQLVAARYLWPIIVPAAVVTGVRTSSLRGNDLVVALGAFCLITAGTHAKTFLSTGSASGIGVEDWRSATTALRQRTAGVPLLVLYRSGFVEEDAEPLGSASPATLAPMRSPGEGRPAWDVLSLTYNRLYIIAFTAVVFAAVHVMLKHTRIGLHIRATSQNRAMASAMGVRCTVVDAMTSYV